MGNKELKRIAHLLRWLGELAVIWFLAFPETGVWTGVVLTLITIGIEWDHVVPEDWS